MDLFRGYVVTKGKQSIEPIKNRTDFKTFEQVKNLPEYAGILASESILIDIDELEASDVLLKIVEAEKLKCRVYKTSRGKHFVFLNNGVETNKTHCKLACGLVSDIKLGTRNSYEILKFENHEREILYDAGEYQEVPKFLTPIKTNMEFLDMEAGAGRNQSLFNYILTLQANNFSVEEAKECIRIINSYVLKVSLSDTEIETILRPEAFSKPVFYNGSTFLFEKFAVYLKNNAYVRKINNQLHLYRDGIFISGQAELESEMIKTLPALSRAKRAEVLSYLDIMIRENTAESGANLIAFRNGILNIKDGSQVGFSPENIVTNKINWDYNPNAYNELADKTLNKLACSDSQVRMLLEEVVGYCMYRRNELGKAFILIGDKANGKSTFLDMVKTMLGENNISALDLKELGDRFKTAELFGKLANLGDDIGDEFIGNPAIFKKLATGERLNVERKGQDPFDFNNYSKLLFSANNIPRIKDKTGAVLRRLVIIPFDARFSSDDPDYRPYIKYELRDQTAVEYLIKIGVEGLKRVLKNRKFTGSDRVDAQLAEYEESNNPIIGFIKEVGDDAIANEPTQEVYRRYHEYCLSNALQAMSNIEFSRQINKRFGFCTITRRIDGKNYRIFVKEE